jgi:hypothetical protein
MPRAMSGCGGVAYESDSLRAIEISPAATTHPAEAEKLRASHHHEA